MSNNMFAPLSVQEKTTVKKNEETDSVAIVPIPLNAQGEYPIKSLERKFIYRDAEKRELMHVCRTRKADGKKADFPVTYRQKPDGTLGWEVKSLPVPRPLYGLDRLAENLDAIVLICEGEKATDAAQDIFPDMVAMTSPNGAGSPCKAEWKVLAGRKVIIWPDHDENGKEYARKVAKLCLEAGAVSVRVVCVPKNFPDKWDLADSVPDNADLQVLLDDAEAIRHPLDGLTERCRYDIGAAYTPEVLEALTELKKKDLPAWMSLRHRLKRVGVGITQLEQAILETANVGGNVEATDHLTLAREVAARVGRENLLATVAHVWLWQDAGVWRPIPDRELKQLVQRSLETQVEITRGLVDAVTDVLKSDIFSSGHIWNPVNDVINVSNGELVWSKNGWVLHPHDREHHCTTQIPVPYEQKADCPRFRQFLSEVFIDDPDAAEKAQAILEMIGYSLCNHARFEKFIILVGQGANGKSVILEIVRLLVGQENAAAVQPSQFSNRFQRAYLYLKLVNIVTEVAEGAPISDAELKAIVSGESMTAEHKHQSPFDFAPYCTLWLGTNHMPHTRDFSDALFRRALVIPFNRVFRAGVDADPHLKDKLAKELPGIMKLALDAYAGVLKRGSFTEPQSCLDAKREWRTQTDQAAQFIEECCLRDLKGEEETKTLFRAYEQWATESGIIRKLNHKNFTQRLEKLGMQAVKTTGGMRVIRGLWLNGEVL